MIRNNPFETLPLHAEYCPFWTVRSRATWEIFQPLRAYVGFQWDSDHFYRADRDDKADKIFYREMRLYAGIRFDLKHIGFEVTGGWASIGSTSRARATQTDTTIGSTSATPPSSSAR